MSSDELLFMATANLKKGIEYAVHQIRSKKVDPEAFTFGLSIFLAGTVYETYRVRQVFKRDVKKDFRHDRNSQGRKRIA